jgi:hypothetical protein
MREIEEIIGQRSVSQRIAAALREEGKRVAAIVGPEGTGKTRAAGLAAHDLGSQYRIIYRKGASLLSESPEAMLVGPESSPSFEERGAVVLDVAQDVAELLERGHIPFSRTLRRLFSIRAKKGRRLLLTDRQQEFLFELGSVQLRPKAFLIADDFHLWDAESRLFLAQVADGLWDDIYPNLKNARLVLVWTPEQAPREFEETVLRLFGRSLDIARLERVRKSDFAELLVALGVDLLPRNWTVRS